MTKARPRTFSDMFACDWTSLSGILEIMTPGQMFDDRITNLAFARPARGNILARVFEIPK